MSALQLLYNMDNLRALSTPTINKVGFVVCTLRMLYYQFYTEPDPKKKQAASAGMVFMMIFSIQVARRLVWAKEGDHDEDDEDAKKKDAAKKESKKKGEKSSARKRTTRAK